MSKSREEKNKSIVMEAFETLFNKRDCRNTNYNDVYERSVEALQALAPAAEKAKVTIGCEPNTCYERFLLSPREFAQFLDDVGSPHVGVLLDTANAHDLLYSHLRFHLGVSSNGLWRLSKCSHERAAHPIAVREPGLSGNDMHGMLALFHH